MDIVDTVDNFVHDFFPEPAECFQIQEKAEKPKTAPANKFNNFHQRDYDFEQLEKQLLNT